MTEPAIWVSPMPRPVTPVAIAGHELSALVRDLAADTSLDDSVRERLARCRDLVVGLDPYLEACTTPESPDLSRLAARTREESWADRAGSSAVGGGCGVLEQEMLSGHVEGQFLKMLVHATGASRVLEIGMFTGYSALAMAEAMGPDGSIVACEIDAYAADIARECFADSTAGYKVDVRVAPALETLASLSQSGEQFELVFIDADKAGYGEYLAAVLDSDLLTPQGLICVDNTLMQGEPWRTGKPGQPSGNGAAIARFNEMVASDARIEQVLLPLRDGLTLIRRTDT
ncbi:class I SAM-dependent methyltransferase [Dermatophilaceae bacterium Sec6.4]